MAASSSSLMISDVETKVPEGGLIIKKVGSFGNEEHVKEQKLACGESILEPWLRASLMGAAESRRTRPHRVGTPSACGLGHSRGVCAAATCSGRGAVKLSGERSDVITVTHRTRGFILSSSLDLYDKKL